MVSLPRAYGGRRLMPWVLVALVSSMPPSDPPGLVASAYGRSKKQKAPATDCRRGKQLCGGKCISLKKVCKEGPAQAAGGEQPAAGAAAEEKRIESASEAVVSQALASQAGQAMIQLARTLAKTGDLDVEDPQREGFRQALRGIKPPLPLCGISHVQLVRECEPIVGGTIALPCYLAVDEMAVVCKLLGQEMPAFK